MLPTPFVAVERAGLVWAASVGFGLVELQSERLPNEMLPGARVQRLTEAHENSAHLAELIAGWSRPVSVELHLASRPSLDARRAVGRVRLAVRLTVRESERDSALARCLADYVVLRTLLGTFWKQAHFAPILDAQSFQEAFFPFELRSAFSVGRRSAEIPLTEPFRGLSSGTFGFQSKPRSAPTGAAIRHLFPWVAGPDDWSALLNTLLDFPAPHWVVARLVTPAERAPYLEELRATLHVCEEFLAGAHGDQVTLVAQADQIRQLCVQRLSRLAMNALQVGVVLMAPGEADEMIARLLGHSISGDSARGPEAGPFAGGFSIKDCDIKQGQDAFFVPGDDPYTAEEAACAFRLPLVFGEDDLGLPVRRSQLARATLPPMEDDRSTTLLALNRYRGETRPIRVPLEHRFKHIAILGMTGTGKSTFMHPLLLQDLRQGHGVCLVDPHGDLADELLGRFPEEREEDLIVVDLADRQCSVPMNFLRWQTPEERDLIIDDLYATFDRLYDFRQTGGPIFEQNFRGMLRLLMGESAEADPFFTLLELPLLYQRREFRRYLVSRSKQEQLRDFVEELEGASGDASLHNLAPYVTSKFSRFLHDQLLRRIVGHGDLNLDFHSILSQRKVLIVKLGRGRFGARAAELLLGLLMSRFRSATMARADIGKVQRAPFFLYVDEMGSLARDENFSQLLSEARKYRLGLVLTTQYASQISGRETRDSVLAAMLGNAGTVVLFRVGVEDAPMLAPLFAPRFGAQDLVELPNFQGYMRLHLDREAVRPFSFEVARPEGSARPERAERLIQASRDRWGVAPKQCDRRAEERRQFVQSLG